jgi:hypothetical protein
MLTCNVACFQPLSEKQYEAISAKMRKLVKPDETLVITREVPQPSSSPSMTPFGRSPVTHLQVEPALVGGFIIRIGNRAQDLSVANQITRMEAHLKDFFAKNNAVRPKRLIPPPDRSPAHLRLSLTLTSV